MDSIINAPRDSNQVLESLSTACQDRETEKPEGRVLDREFLETSLAYPTVGTDTARAVEEAKLLECFNEQIERLLQIPVKKLNHSILNRS